MKPIIRWTIGPVSDIGFECLKLSYTNIKKLIKNEVLFVICYNNLNQRQIKKLPKVDLLIDQKKYCNIYNCKYPQEKSGTAWKLYPPRIDINANELILDNDVIIYKLPVILNNLNSNNCAITEAYKRSYYGIIENFIPFNFNINSGVVYLTGGYDYETDIRNFIDKYKINWCHHFTEQTLVANLAYKKNWACIKLSEIQVCVDYLKMGSCGLHLVGLNSENSECGTTLIKNLSLI